MGSEKTEQSDSVESVVHTPGPWEIRDWDIDADCRRFSTIARHGELDIVGDGIKVGSVPADCDDGEGLANARLVAAAPDLLEACRMLTKDSFDGSDESIVALEAGLAAIKKATSVE